MSRRPLAEVRVIRLPHVAVGCVRIEVECRGSVTGLTSVPAPNGPEQPVPALVTAAAFAHAERCDAGCDLTAVHARGAQDLREETERAYAAIRERRVRRHFHGRRT